MNNPEHMGTQPIPSLLAKFAVPSIIGLLVHASYNIADRLFVGMACGAPGLAGITLAAPIMSIQFGLSILLGVGASTVISIRLGEQRIRDAQKILGNVTTLTAGLSVIVITIGVVWLDPILSLFGTSEAVWPSAFGYLQIIFAGTLPLTVAFVYSFIIRSAGDPKTSMYMLVASSILNIALDPVFIFVLDMGTRGAALATVLSQTAAAVWSVWYFLTRKSVLRFQMGNFIPDWLSVRSIFALGAASCLMDLAMGIGGGFTNRQLQMYGGDVAVASMGVIFAVILLVVLPIFGICDGAQPILGYNHGARKHERVKATMIYSLGAATVFSLLAWVLVEFIPGLLAYPFCGDNAELLAHSTRALRITFLAAPVIGFQIVGSRHFQSVGRPVLSTMLGVSRQLFLLIPLLILLPMWLGEDGVWATAPVADVLAALMTGVWIWKEFRRLSAEAEAETLRPAEEPVMEVAETA